MVFVRPLTKSANETIRWGIKVEEGGQTVLIKFWNEHAQNAFKQGQKVLVKNLRTSIFREHTTLNSTDETSVSICVFITE